MLPEEVDAVVAAEEAKLLVLLFPALAAAPKFPKGLNPASAPPTELPPPKPKPNPLKPSEEAPKPNSDPGARFVVADCCC